MKPNAITVFYTAVSSMTDEEKDEAILYLRKRVKLLIDENKDLREEINREVYTAYDHNEIFEDDYTGEIE